MPSAEWNFLKCIKFWLYSYISNPFNILKSGGQIASSPPNRKKTCSAFFCQQESHRLANKYFRLTVRKYPVFAKLLCIEQLKQIMMHPWDSQTPSIYSSTVKANTSPMSEHVPHCLMSMGEERSVSNSVRMKPTVYQLFPHSITPVTSIHLWPLLYFVLVLVTFLQLHLWR